MQLYNVFEVIRKRVCTVQQIIKSIAAACVAGLVGTSAANAATASFVTPPPGDPSGIVGASDGAGVLLTSGDTTQIVFSEALGAFDIDGVTPINDSITLFRLTDAPGLALATISFGRLDAGVVSIVSGPFSFLSGDTSAPITGSGLATTFGCGAVGGCNLIEITAGATFFGPASGLVIDAIEIDGTPLTGLTPVSAAPEPTAWAFMMLGFALCGWNGKTARKRRQERASLSTAIADGVAAS